MSASFQSNLRLAVSAVVVLATSVSKAQRPAAHQGEKTSFQVSAPWQPEYDVRADIAMVYGMDSTFTERVKLYREKGYNVQFMTGIAWGEYQDYFTGKYDGTVHNTEGQVERNGNEIGHGVGIPYVVPTKPYIAYFKKLVRKVIDAGITSIYLEEPEFWARAGYSESFKKEWQQFYGFPWMPQHESPEATYLSSKLKYQLYFNALKEVFADAKAYSESKGRRVKCYVPTHSLLNYASWQIVSPEASLAALEGMDGYIAQVWTGTSREPVYFNGLKKERVFENAFLEYGSMLSMTAPTGRRIYFLTDPIEDWPRSWDDYKQNYQATYTAQLLYPTVSHYEVMPWPNRIYLGKFKVAGQEEKQPISPAYATQMQVMINALNDMPASTNKISGSHGIGVLVGNSMMFQRFPTHNGYEDPQLSNFYGMILPLIKRGIPAETVHMENLGFPGTLKDIRVLVMSYANMKPQTPAVHAQLTKWVKAGGVLLYYGRDADPFQSVKEWWNTGSHSYKAPSAHLFEQLQVTNAPGSYAVGKGKVHIIQVDPKELVLQSAGDTGFMQLIQQAYEREAKAGKLQTSDHFYLERGPFNIVSVLDETTGAKPFVLQGPMIDLFDPELPVLTKKSLEPGQQALLYDLRRKHKKAPAVLCAASRVYEEKRTARSYEFITLSPSGTKNVMRVLLAAKPSAVTVTGTSGATIPHELDWDEGSHTARLRFDNNADGIRVRLSW